MTAKCVGARRAPLWCVPTSSGGF